MPGEERGFLAGLIDGMRCGILAIDRQGSLVMVNEVGRQVLQLERAPAPGTAIRHVLAEHPQLVQVLTESFTMSSLPNRAELDLFGGTEREKTIGFTISMIPGDGGRASGAAMFFKDLTRIEHREEQERLHDRLAALGQMAASLAHEIRNPLASIEVSCSLLRRRLPPDGDSHGLLDKIAAEVARLNRSVSSSLEFVKPVTLQLALAEIGPVLREAVTVATERHARPAVGVVLDVPEEPPPFLMDRSQLRQVFENLLLNAVEAVGTRGRVRVQVRVVPAPGSSHVPYRPHDQGRDPWQEFDEFVVVRISDSGPGIPPEERDRIFYPFFTTKKQGSGVGLSTVKKIVDSHRGLIDVDTAEEGGACFTVRLPMVCKEQGMTNR